MKTMKQKDVKKLLESVSHYQLTHTKITMIKTTNHKENGRFYKRNEVVSTENITLEQYILILESISWFIEAGGKEIIQKGYTVAGYIPTELVSVSPDGTSKTTRTFTFELK